MSWKQSEAVRALLSRNVRQPRTLRSMKPIAKAVVVTVHQRKYHMCCDIPCGFRVYGTLSLSDGLDIPAAWQEWPQLLQPVND